MAEVGTVAGEQEGNELPLETSYCSSATASLRQCFPEPHWGGFI